MVRRRVAKQIGLAGLSFRLQVWRSYAARLFLVSLHFGLHAIEFML